MEPLIPTPNAYIYKKEIDWSVLQEGFTLPVNSQVVFGQIMGRFLQRGDQKIIHLVLNGKSYDAKIVNVDFSAKYKDAHKNDILQIRYTRNGDMARALQAVYPSTYSYIKNLRDTREEGDRSIIRVPEDAKEYLVLYTTEYDDTFLLDTIQVGDPIVLQQQLSGHTEQEIENELNYTAEDAGAHIVTDMRAIKLRRLDRSIGENLKLLYDFRCQICGQPVGKEYGEHIAEAHHIDYFVKSMNNDSSNILVLCPNHHRVIHRANPVFDHKKLLYTYDNGLQEGLRLNKHL